MTDKNGVINIHMRYSDDCWINYQSVPGLKVHMEGTHGQMGALANVARRKNTVGLNSGHDESQILEFASADDFVAFLKEVNGKKLGDLGYKLPQSMDFLTPETASVEFEEIHFNPPIRQLGMLAKDVIQQKSRDLR